MLVSCPWQDVNGCPRLRSPCPVWPGERTCCACTLLRQAGRRGRCQAYSLLPHRRPRRSTQRHRSYVLRHRVPSVEARGRHHHGEQEVWRSWHRGCLLYTSDAADDLLCVDLGGRRIIKKKKK